MVQTFYAIKSEKSINTGMIVSTVFAFVVAGGCYFLGGFGRLFSDRIDIAANGYDSVIPAMLDGLPDILIAIVVLIIFRRTVFSFITERFNLHHAPPLAIWLVMLVVCYIFVFIGNFMQDMTSVCWMGLVGCGIGTILTYISERFDVKDVTPNG
jgi:hypothetical protein